MYVCMYGLIVLFSQSCSKDPSSGTEQIAENNRLNALALLSDPQDRENHLVNQSLYIFSRAIQEALQDERFLSYAKRYLDADAKQYGTSIVTLAQHNADFSKAIASSIRRVLEADGLTVLVGEVNLLSDNQLIEKLVQLMICRSKNYEPVIHYVGRESAATPRNQDIIIAIGQEVNDADEVLAYRNGEETPFLLSEEAALSSTDIIIFVGVGDIPDSDVDPIVIGDEDVIIDGNQVTFRVDVDIDVDRHQIKNGHRYESSNQSEVRAWIIKYGPGGYSFREWQDFDPRNIHKDDINASRIFTNNLNAFGFNPTDFGSGQEVFVGAWESDWYASFKRVANPCSTELIHSMDARMKFSDEWYFFDCGRANLWWPSVSSNEIFENEKCMFDLIRTQ